MSITNIMLMILLLVIQLAYIPFVFWFVELGQNTLTYKVTGQHGWIYPTSPYGWFSFESLISWTTMVIIFWSMYWFVFIPFRLPFWFSMGVSTIVGWVSEWLFGALAVPLFGHPMQIWPRSPLVYVSYFAIVWWFMNSVLFYILVILVPTIAAKLINGPVQQQIGKDQPKKKTK